LSKVCHTLLSLMHALHHLQPRYASVTDFTVHEKLRDDSDHFAATF
jgi:hypothetical protein